jgi:hypothetical protein
VIFVHLLPCLALVMLNYLLFSGMRKAEMRKARLMKSTSEGRRAVLLNGIRKNSLQSLKSKFRRF